MMSPEIDLLAAALVKAQGEFEAVGKDSTNPHYKSKFASLSNVFDTVRPILAKNGLAVTQHPDAGDVLTTYLLHSSGQFISHSMPLHLAKNDPQGMGSAMTYARRYSVMAVLGVVSGDEDDDGQAASRQDNNSRFKDSADTHPEDLSRPFVADDPQDALDPGPLVVRKGKLRPAQRGALMAWIAEQAMPEHPKDMNPDQRAAYAARLSELEAV